MSQPIQDDTTDSSDESDGGESQRQQEEEALVNKVKAAVIRRDLEAVKELLAKPLFGSIPFFSLVNMDEEFAVVHFAAYHSSGEDISILKVHLCTILTNEYDTKNRQHV